MTRRLLISTLALIVLAACGGQQHAVKKGTTLSATDTGGVSAATDIQVVPAGESIHITGPTVKETDDLLPSNTDKADDKKQDGSRLGQGILDAAVRKVITVGVAVAGENSENGATSFAPASITKLITTGIALETLGPDFHFTHTFSYRMIDDNKGVVSGFKWIDDGDPSLANRFFAQFGKKQMPTLDGFAQKLRAAGIQSIKGKIQLVSADARLDGQESAPGVEASDRRSFFGAVPTAFTYANNYPIRSISAGKESVHTAFVRALKAAGISVDESDGIEGGTPATLEIQSPALRELIVPMNKASDNLVADTLFMTIALRHSGASQGLNDAGRRVYAETLRKWMTNEGTPALADELNFFDGSGLSRNDRVTADAYLAVLKYFIKQNYFQIIFDSLPIAGVDGTLGTRMTGTATRGIVHAKTGTLRDNYQLAGFIPRLNADGKTARAFVPFVVLTKTPDGAVYRLAAHTYQDEIVAQLASQINPALK